MRVSKSKSKSKSNAKRIAYKSYCRECSQLRAIIACDLDSLEQRKIAAKEVAAHIRAGFRILEVKAGNMKIEDFCICDLQFTKLIKGA